MRPKPDCLVGRQATAKMATDAATHSVCLEGEGHGCAEDAGGPAAGKNGGLQCAQSYKRLGDEDIMF